VWSRLLRHRLLEAGTPLRLVGARRLLLQGNCAVPPTSSPRSRGVSTLLAGLALLAAVVLPAAPAAAAPTPPTFGSEIEALSPYQGQKACDPVAQPGVVKFRDMVLAAYPGTGDSGIARACTAGGTSEHKEGRAWDWRVNTSSPEQVEQVEDLMEWLLAEDEYGHTAAMARRLGVMYMIWDSRVWKSYQAAKGWQPYSGASPHTDHVHLSFSWAGALAETSYWSGKVAPVMASPHPEPEPEPGPMPETGTISDADTATPTVSSEQRRAGKRSLPGPWRRH
jgi:hypothetical protein